MGNVFLKKCLSDFKCDRALLAKIHPLSISTAAPLVFSTIFEQNIYPQKTIAHYVKNIPFKVIDIEFENDWDKLVIVHYDNKKYPPACIQHLNKLGMHTIVNQLLYIDQYLWGIFSIQYVKKPLWSEDDILLTKFKIAVVKAKLNLIKSILEN